jgi:hypothetical protein
MNIFSNDRLIRRNRRIGLIATLSGLIVLGIGMFISFRYPDLFSYSLLALLVGFILSQVGIYYGNRWGKSPRPDEVLTQALKGFDSKYTLYNYSSPVSHLLVGPAGLWILKPYYQRGTIWFSNGRWKQKGGNWYLKIFAQEGIGRPELEIEAEQNALIKLLNKELPDIELPKIQVALVFFHPQAEIIIDEDENPPALTIHASKLKEFIRKSAKSKALTIDLAEKINEILQA